MNGRVLLAVVAGLLGACQGPTDAVPAVGMLAWERTELVAESAEPIVERPLPEGALVHAGDVIVKLDTRRAQAQLDGAVATHAQALAKLAELRRGPRAESIRAARARLAGAEQVLEVRSRELERVRKLVMQKLSSPDAVDSARAQMESVRAERDANRASLDELEAGATAEELAQAEQAVRQAAAAVRVQRVTLERLTIRAPVDGRLDALPLEVGERPSAGAVVAVLLAGSAPYARVYVPEAMRVRIQPGVAARVVVDGLTAPVPGEVRWVSSDPAFTPYYALTEHDRGRLSYVAKVDLKGGPRNLPAGVPVQVSFAGADGAP
jgi:HlyD family secretion protein